MEIDYTKQQRDAIDAIIEWFKQIYRNPQADQSEREFYLAGYAGVGKTTIAKTIIEELMGQFGLTDVVTASYTGKAVDVLRNKGVYNPRTGNGCV